MNKEVLAEIALLSLRTALAEPYKNAERLCAELDRLKESCVFTQALSLVGQGAGDLLFNPSFLDACEEAVDYVLKHAPEDKLVGVGVPLRAVAKCGIMCLVPCYVLLKGGEVKAVLKSPAALPSYFQRIDGSGRYFKDAAAGTTVSIMGSPCCELVSKAEVDGLTIVIPEEADALCGGTLPVSLSSQSENTVLLNLSRAPYEKGSIKAAVESAKKLSQGFSGVVAYLSSLGCEGAYLYSGLCILASEGKVAGLSESFTLKRSSLAVCGKECALYEGYDEMVKAVAMGIMDYMEQSHSRGIALSLSGGADSALCATAVFYMAISLLEDVGKEDFVKRLAACGVMVEAQGDLGKYTYIKEKVMPKLLVTLYQGSQYSGDITYTAAHDLSHFLGATHFSWSIAPVVNDYIKMYDDLGCGNKLSWETDDLAMQNIQARSRLPGIWLVANREGRLLLATSNLSEAVVGYCTMDGDTAGGLSPIAGIGKSVVRRINAFLEKEGLKTAEGRFKVSALDKVNAQAPTAELRPGGTQTDEGDLMPYVLLDAIRMAFTNNLGVKEMVEAVKKDPNCQNFEECYIKECMAKYFKLHARSQWKRERFATGFHVEHDDASPESFWHFPIFSSDLKVLSDRL